jgi:hypothetical protein
MAGGSPDLSGPLRQTQAALKELRKRSRSQQHPGLLRKDYKSKSKGEAINEPLPICSLLRTRCMKREELERRCQKMRAAHSKESAPVGEMNVSDEGVPLTIQQAAQKLGRTEWWTRAYFRKVAGALVMVSPKKRGIRRYQTVTVPVDVFERELSKFRV